jgi:hypothetical protein
MNIFGKQSRLRAKLSEKLNFLKVRQSKLKSKLLSKLGSLKFFLGNVDLDIIVAHCEVNDRQGVGVLLKKIFVNSENILSIRSRNLYDGHQDFGFHHVCLNNENKTREQILSNVSRLTDSLKLRRILSVPYFTDDVLISLALKDLLDIPLCTYLMDDQNIHSHNIPDHYMKELLEKSDLRLGISQDLCRAYEEKYNLKFWFLPPTVDAHLIQTHSPSISREDSASKPGVLIGNIWSQQWLDKLRLLTQKTGNKIHWYGNPNRDWLSFKEAELAIDGISFEGYYPEKQLIGALREAPYAVILTGTSDDTKDRPELAKLSLPSRLTYLIAVANIPIIVIGSRETAAAKFVDDLRLGIVCDYTPDSFQQAISEICLPERQQAIRQQAAYLAYSLSAENISTWIWRSLEKGEPINLKFEQFGKTLSDASAVITAFEINRLHGTGPLVKRIVEGTPNILSIHSMDMYDGEHDFGDLSLFISHTGLATSEMRLNIIRNLGDNTVSQILCVPYRSDDLITAITLSELYNAPLGTYIMDDQNICVNNIPDSLMEEFLSKCSLRFATHPELRDAYEAKYNLKFWLLPAVVPDDLICKLPQHFDWTEQWASSGVLLGSIWSKQWFDMLCASTKGAGIQLDWYGNTQYPWMTVEAEETQQWGINPCGLLPEEELVEKLKRYAFVVVPTGTMDSRDDRKELSRLSLPGRIIFALATSNTPIIILGHKESPAARFVERFMTGIVCEYNGESLRSAVTHVTNPDVQRHMRQCAASVASQFSSKDISRWLWKSIELGQLSDWRFEELFSSADK